MMIRCPVSELARFQGLDGQLLRVGSGFIELGQLEGRSITEKSELTARLVIIKAGGDAHSEPFQFGVAVGKKIAGLKCHIELGPRRCLRTKDHKIIGYGLTLSKLLPEISIELQCNGLGGKQRMGCGVLI